MWTLCDVPVLSNVCDAVGDTASALVTAPFEWLAQAIGNTAAMMFKSVWTVFDQTTLVDVTSEGYISVYNVLFGIGICFMLGFFLLQLITGLVRRDPSALSRAALGLMKSVLGSFLVITLTALLLEIVDQLCIGIVQATGNTLEGMGGKIGVLIAGLTGLTLASPGVGAIIMIFFGALAIAAAAIVWFSLLIRKALLLVAIVLAPIALSGASWDVTRGWFGKWASFVLALIVSKLVITVVFLVAITQVDEPIDFDLAALSDPIAGIVLMAIAGFAPYMVYKFVTFLGFDLYQVMSAEQEAKQSLNRPLPVPKKPEGDGPDSVLKGKKDSDGSSSPDGASSSSPSQTPGAPTEPAAVTETTEATSGTAAGGATAAAGPVAVAVVAAEVAKDSAEAGVATGEGIGDAADGQLDASQDGNSTPSSTAPPSPTSPGPGTPDTPPPPNAAPPADIPPSSVPPAPPTGTPGQ